jgi:hypothetical protein
MKKCITSLVPAICLVVLLVPLPGTVSGHGMPNPNPAEHRYPTANSEGSPEDNWREKGIISIHNVKEDHAATKQTVTSERGQIGDNSESLIWTWGKFEGDVPLSIGVTFTEPALDDMFTAEPDGDFPRLLPHLAAPELEPGRVYDIPFPAKVRETTPFNHMGWFANQQGHAPQGIFDLAHVDVHFFTITLEERQAISGQLTDPKLLELAPEGFLPDDYFLPMIPNTDLPGTNDAEQGLHWVDQFAPEFQGERFRQIFIYGTYDGQVNFWEPMITKQFFEDLRAFLNDLQSTGKSIALTFVIKQPTKFLKTSYYPTRYTIRYNASTSEFSVSLDKFVQRVGEIN